jgi:hypothetical protein
VFIAGFGALCTDLDYDVGTFRDARWDFRHRGSKPALYTISLGDVTDCLGGCEAQSALTLQEQDATQGARDTLASIVDLLESALGRALQ